MAKELSSLQSENKSRKLIKHKPITKVPVGTVTFSQSFMHNDRAKIKKGGSNPLKLSDEDPELYYRALVYGEKNKYSNLKSVQEGEGEG